VACSLIIIKRQPVILRADEGLEERRGKDAAAVPLLDQSPHARVETNKGVVTVYGKAKNAAEKNPIAKLVSDILPVAGDPRS